MKKSFLTMILAMAMLLPACVYGSPSTSFDAESATTESSSSDKGNGGDGGNHSAGGDTVGENNAHTDSNNDGKCDDCKKNVRFTLDFYSINDLHGKFKDTEAQVGVDELSTYLKTAKANNPYTFLLSAGDMWQGSPESNVTKGALMTEWMNEMDFVSMTLGNHEFDWGTDYIESNATLAEFPFLGINVFDKNTNKRVDYCQPSVVVEQGEVKVGVIGAIGNCLSSISGEYNQELEFKTGATLSKLIIDEATRLREEEGVNFVVYSRHEDYGAEYDVALSNGHVDLVFEGHSHQNYVRADSRGVYHLQGGGDNEEGISHAKVTLNIANGKYSTQAQNISTTAYQNLADDEVVDNLLEKYETTIAPVYQTLGDNARKRESGEILSLCAQLYYEAGAEKWGKDYNIFLGGGYMSARAPYYLAAGSLSYANLMNVLPFDNQLVLCSVKGRDLKSKFLETTNNKYYVYCGEYGENNRDSVVDDGTYYVITDMYSSTHSANNLTEIERYDVKTERGEYVFARDLLAEYVKAGNWSANGMKASTISELLTVGNSLAANAVSAEDYLVRGEVTEVEIYNNKVHIYIQDAAGNSLYVYNLDCGSYTLAQGDQVLLCGKMKKYVSNSNQTIIELVNATVKELT